MHASRWIVCGAILGGLAVVFGAFGAHGLEQRLSDLGFSEDELESRIQDRFEPAVRYQMYSAFGLIAVGWIGRVRLGRWIPIAGGSLLVGAILFSGLLYALTFTGPSWNGLGAIVPIGGVLMIVGWLAMALAAWRLPPARRADDA